MSPGVLEAINMLGALMVLACFSMPPCCGLLGLVEVRLTLVDANLKSPNILNDVSSVPHGGWTMTRISWPSGMAARTASQAQHGAVTIFGRCRLTQDRLIDACQTYRFLLRSAYIGIDIGKIQNISKYRIQCIATNCVGALDLKMSASKPTSMATCSCTPLRARIKSTPEEISGGRWREWKGVEAKSLTNLNEAGNSM